MKGLSASSKYGTGSKKHSGLGLQKATTKIPKILATFKIIVLGTSKIAQHVRVLVVQA